MERTFEGLTKFVEFLERQAVVAEVAVEGAAAITTDHLHDTAHKTFGDLSKLAPLAPSTQAERTRLGFTPNDPLLRDGSLLRDNVEKEHQGGIAAIGSSEPVQLYHEYGYVNARTGTSVPPRPVFKIALEESEAFVVEAQKALISATLGLGAISAIKKVI